MIDIIYFFSIIIGIVALIYLEHFIHCKRVFGKFIVGIDEAEKYWKDEIKKERKSENNFS